MKKKIDYNIYLDAIKVLNIELDNIIDDYENGENCEHLIISILEAIKRLQQPIYNNDIFISPLEKRYKEIKEKNN